MLDIELYAASGRLFDNHYKLIRPLSTEGGTADVWLALDLNTVTDPDAVGDLTHIPDDEIEKLGLIVAIKIYRPQNALDVEGEQRFRDEYMIVFNCHHTNLIHPTHFSIFKEVPYLVLPYCKLGSSEVLIGTLTGEDNIWKYIGDVSSGLAYLHALEPPIIHQDIKPGNVLIDDNLNYSITDFGISAKSGKSDSSFEDEERSGTLAYMAPERYHEGSEPSPASDIWAFGATLYEIITGNVPYGEEGGWAQVEQTAPMPALPQDIPADIQRLIYACLDPDPEKRPTAQYISEAAAVRQFPIKKKKTGLIIVLCALCALLMGVATTYFLRSPEVQVITEEAYRLSPEEAYDIAMEKMGMADADSMRVGVELMDSLSGVNYVPALYQMAYTYGWFSDSASVARKKLLDIDIFTSGNSRYMPKGDSWSNKAVAYFTTILEQNDTTYAQLNAEAAYRLACYYVMPNDIFKQNTDKGKAFLLSAKDWATIARDSALLERINKGLATFEN